MRTLKVLVLDLPDSRNGRKLADISATRRVNFVMKDSKVVRDDR